VKLNPNENEVMDTQYVTPQQLKDLFNKRNEQIKRKELKEGEEQLFITPWFEIICNEFLFNWWKDLHNILKNGGITEKVNTIHRLSLPV